MIPQERELPRQLPSLEERLRSFSFCADGGSLFRCLEEQVAIEDLLEQPRTHRVLQQLIWDKYASRPDAPYRQPVLELKGGPLRSFIYYSFYLQDGRYHYYFSPEETIYTPSLTDQHDVATPTILSCVSSLGGTALSWDVEAGWQPATGPNIYQPGIRELMQWARR